MNFDPRQIDRRIIYLLVFIALSVPLVLKWSVKPARMLSAEKLYSLIESTKVEPGDIVLLALDFGPNSKAENYAQAQVIIEHLMRRRIPFATYSLYAQAEPFLGGIPEQVAQTLMKEQPEERWQYGKDWVNLGLRLQGFLTVQGIATSDNIHQILKTDAQGTALAEVPAFSKVKTLKNIPLFIQITSLVGTFETYVQFLQKGDIRPVFAHACTSITIPKAYIYLDSGQLQGLLEGIAGAAWYSHILKEKYPLRLEDDSARINTGLGVAQLMIVLLIAIGNLMELLLRSRS